MWVGLTLFHPVLIYKFSKHKLKDPLLNFGLFMDMRRNIRFDGKKVKSTYIEYISNFNFFV